MQNAPPVFAVTQQDIARRAGVSVMTVSRALSDKAGVSAHRAAEIRALAEEMGYVPNPLVQSLMRSRKHPGRGQDSALVLGWYGMSDSGLRPGPTRNAYNPFAEYRRGAEWICVRRGFRIDEVSDRQVELHRAIDIFRARGVRGLLLGPKRDDPRAVPTLSVTDLRIVQIGRSRAYRNVDCVASDHFVGMRHCVEALRKVGHRRIAYLDSAGRVEHNQRRDLAAFVLDAGADAPWNLIDDARAPEDLLCRLLDSSSPDALVVGGNKATNALLSHPSPPPFVVLNRNGLPDWISGSEASHFDVGAAAARKLIDDIVGPQESRDGGLCITTEERWHEGTSHLPRAGKR